jgi:hypothetical protein
MALGSNQPLTEKSIRNILGGKERPVRKAEDSPAEADSPLADSSTLKKEAIRSSETSVYARYTQCHIPEDDILNCDPIV